MVTWVVESNIFDPVFFDKVISHLRDRGIPHHTRTIRPFSHEVVGGIPDIDGPAVILGSTGLQKLARDQGWVPGVWTGEGLSETAAISALGHLMVNADARVMKLSQVRDYVFEHGHDAEYFLKPNTDTKEFAGEVMTGYEFVPWHAKMVAIDYLKDDQDFDVVVSSAKQLGCEWRVFVVDGEISSSSLYRQYQRVMPERHILPEVRDLVMTAHARFEPAPVYVVDVAQVGDDFRIMEFNTFNSAGFYACDVAKILDDVTAYVDRTY